VAVAVVDATNTPISGIAAVAAGFYHTCALTTLGDVVCWGDNSAGELGYYLAPSKSSTAVQVVGLPSSKAIAAGFSFSCALTTAGAVECWGYNAQGQLGNNSTTNSPSPVQVSGLTSGVTAISAGLDSACALLSTGAVQCWGYNNGNLGIPTTPSPSLPVTVTGLTAGVAKISAGTNYACALLGGSVKCWGSNAFGRLGHPPANTVPAGVSSLSSGVGQLALGFVHTCAMTPEEGMRCWGSNEFGQLGNASISMGQSGLSVVPVAVQGLSSAAVAIATGADHTCAVTANGSGVSCWGDNNRGQLGNNSISATGTASPVAVLDSSFAPIKDVGTLTAGVAHTCALTLTGGVKCWGRGDFGELGDNSKGDSLVAVSVVNGSNVPISAITTIVAGGYHTCALTGAGTVQCWGDDLQGQLGDNDAAKQSKATPANVVGLPGFALSIAAGDFHTCALNTAGAVYCWGSNGSGQLGNTSVAVGATSIVPVPVSGLASGVIAIAAGSTHSCALTTAGAVKCWGANAMGQLGDGTNGQKTTPVGVSGLSVGAVAISAGGDHTCAQTASDALKCWGSNSNGQIGDNMLLNQPQLVPATVSPGQSIKFSPPGNMRVGSLTLSATPSSGLQAAFDTWTPTICQVNGNTLTATASGICGVRASQQGVINATGRGSSIAAAPQQLRLIIVGDPIFADGFE
jgi:alpha-tubulin suppressor-like RCC1 family protein